MKRNTSIVILLATYNGEEFLAQQINSILNQTNTNWKLLIHDDNSTDNTTHIIKQYQKKYPDKIHFFDDTASFNSASANFNFLLKKAYSEYIMFCDQDDIWLPRKIELTFEKIKEMEKKYEDSPLLVHTDLKIVDSELNPVANSYWKYQNINPHKDAFTQLLVQNTITGCTVMINKNAAELASPVPNNIIMHDWWIGLVVRKFGHISQIDESTILYRQHKNNDTGAKKYSKYFIFKSAVSILKKDCTKYKIQAEIFLNRYKNILDKDTIRMLNDFTGSKGRVVNLLKHKIIKQGIIRNIGFFICQTKK